MGDLRFEYPYASIRDAPDRARALRELRDEEVVSAAAAAGLASDGYLANVLATEASNRILLVRAILETMGEGVLALGPDGRVKYVNPSALQLLGGGPEELRGTALSDVLPGLAAADGLPAPGKGDADVTTRDGRHLTIAYTVTPLAREGREAGAVIVFRDVTETRRTAQALRESEARYRQLVMQAPDAMLLHQDGRVLLANRAAAHLMRVTRPEELVGASILDFVHPRDREKARERARRALEAGEPQPPALERILRPDGTTVDVEIAAMPIIQNGRPAVLVSGRDVTLRPAP